MAIEQWQLATYQSAATAMCYQLNEDPNQPMRAVSGGDMPRWMLYAAKMAEHAVMVQCMRNHGHAA